MIRYEFVANAVVLQNVVDDYPTNLIPEAMQITTTLPV
jgi:hypothetical protein